MSSAGRDGADGPPPLPPRELARGPAVERQFEHDGRSWVARLSGKSAYGTGSFGLGLVDAVHFADAAAPELPLFEALLAHGRFHGMFDEELRVLLKRSVAIDQPGSR
jgi:hypothetical protein